MFGLFKKKRRIGEVETRKIKVHGFPFEIKKLDVLSYLDGSKTMLQEFATYAQVKESEQSIEKGEATLKKMKSHFTDVFMASVIEPKLVRKKEDSGPNPGDPLFVDHLFSEWDLATELYQEILEFTYGKKKSIFDRLRVKRS